MRYWIALTMFWAGSCGMWAAAALPVDADKFNNYGTIVVAAMTIIWGAYELGRSK